MLQLVRPPRPRPLITKGRKRLRRAGTHGDLFRSLYEHLPCNCSSTSVCRLPLFPSATSGAPCEGQKPPAGRGCPGPCPGVSRRLAAAGSRAVPWQERVLPALPGPAPVEALGTPPSQTPADGKARGSQCAALRARGIHASAFGEGGHRPQPESVTTSPFMAKGTSRWGDILDPQGDRRGHEAPTKCKPEAGSLRCDNRGRGQSEATAGKGAPSWELMPIRAAGRNTP